MAAGNYNTWAGGGVNVQLTQKFIQTLGIGQHSITFQFKDGSCATVFTVHTNAVPIVSTGDTSNMAFWMGMLSGAAVLAIGLAVLKKRYWD